MQERWSIEPFTDVLSGGPETGPAEQAHGTVHSMCSDKKGNLYLASGQFIDIIAINGMRRHLAGTGYPGHRDGPASSAMFRLGFKTYYGAFNISCGSDGSIYVADGGNSRIKKIYKNDNSWYVKTIAGGGKLKLKPGESASPVDIRLKGTLIVLALPNGQTIIASNNGYYRMNKSETSIKFASKWNIKNFAEKGRKKGLKIISGDVDNHGNAYILARSPNIIIRINPEGKTEHIAGLITKTPPKPHHIGDTIPLKAFFDSTNSLVSNIDGSVIYVCGGDEYNIRRVPTNGTSKTATLMQNGYWYHASVHPNKSRGAAFFRPCVNGKLKPDGALKILRVAPLLGRDNNGNLYGKLNSWSGMTQYIENQGLIGTRVFRIRKEGHALCN